MNSGKKKRKRNIKINRDQRKEEELERIEVYVIVMHCNMCIRETNNFAC